MQTLGPQTRKVEVAEIPYVFLPETAVQELHPEWSDSAWNLTGGVAGASATVGPV